MTRRIRLRRSSRRACSRPARPSSGRHSSISSPRSRSGPPWPRRSAREWSAGISSRLPSSSRGLCGAIVWNLITWFFGLPTSSSHALFGGYAGAAVAKAGFGAIIPAGWTKTLIFIVLAPLIGLVVGPGVDDGDVLGVPLVPAGQGRSMVPPAAARVGSGIQPEARRNDAQKTMGSSPACCSRPGYIERFHIPLWVVSAAHAAIGLGTLSGGWRIIHTMGSKITKLQPVGGFAAETGAAHRDLHRDPSRRPRQHDAHHHRRDRGVGATRRLSAVRWGVAGQIVWAWVLTIPASARLRQLLTPSCRRRGRLDSLRSPRRAVRAASASAANVGGSPTVKTRRRPGAVGGRTVPPVQLDEVLDDREAQPGAARVARREPLVDAVEALEDARQVRLRDARAVVGYRRSGRRVLRARRR